MTSALRSLFLSPVELGHIIAVAPKLDWHHPHASVAQAVAAAKAAYRAQNAAENLQLDTPTCLAEFNNDIQSRVIRFLSTP